MECIFCKIIQGEVPCKIIYEDSFVIAFEDIYPSATNHVLVIPKIHIQSLNDIDEKNISYINIDETGYRIVNNCGGHAFQSVKHLHFHIVGGEELSPTFC